MNQSTYAKAVIPASFAYGEAARRSPRPLAGEGLGEREMAGIHLVAPHVEVDSRVRGNDSAANNANCMHGARLTA
ncbi:MAG: hypothetical protein JWL63_984 [Rhodocyclales bacterium]|nr:hypothetical protein [Rhodocyclales bacterium]